MPVRPKRLVINLHLKKLAFRNDLLHPKFGFVPKPIKLIEMFIAPLFSLVSRYFTYQGKSDNRNNPVNYSDQFLEIQRPGYQCYMHSINERQ